MVCQTWWQDPRCLAVIAAVSIGVIALIAPMLTMHHVVGNRAAKSNRYHHQRAAAPLHEGFLVYESDPLVQLPPKAPGRRFISAASPMLTLRRSAEDGGGRRRPINASEISVYDGRRITVGGGGGQGGATLTFSPDGRHSVERASGDGGGHGDLDIQGVGTTVIDELHLKRGVRGISRERPLDVVASDGHVVMRVDADHGLVVGGGSGDGGQPRRGARMTTRTAELRGGSAPIALHGTSTTTKGGGGGDRRGRGGTASSRFTLGIPHDTVPAIVGHDRDITFPGTVHAKRGASVHGDTSIRGMVRIAGGGLHVSDGGVVTSEVAARDAVVGALYAAQGVHALPPPLPAQQGTENTSSGQPPSPGTSLLQLGSSQSRSVDARGGVAIPRGRTVASRLCTGNGRQCTTAATMKELGAFADDAARAGLVARLWEREMDRRRQGMENSSRVAAEEAARVLRNKRLEVCRDLRRVKYKWQSDKTLRVAPPYATGGDDSGGGSSNTDKRRGHSDPIPPADTAACDFTEEEYDMATYRPDAGAPGVLTPRFSNVEDAENALFIGKGPQAPSVRMERGPEVRIRRAAKSGDESEEERDATVAANADMSIYGDTAPDGGHATLNLRIPSDRGGGGGRLEIRPRQQQQQLQQVTSPVVTVDTNEASPGLKLARGGAAALENQVCFVSPAATPASAEDPRPRRLAMAGGGAGAVGCLDARAFRMNYIMLRFPDTVVMFTGTDFTGDYYPFARPAAGAAPIAFGDLDRAVRAVGSGSATALTASTALASGFTGAVADTTLATVTFRSFIVSSSQTPLVASALNTLTEVTEHASVRLFELPNHEGKATAPICTSVADVSELWYDHTTPCEGFRSFTIETVSARAGEALECVNPTRRPADPGREVCDGALHYEWTNIDQSSKADCPSDPDLLNPNVVNDIAAGRTYTSVPQHCRFTGHYTISRECRNSVTGLPTGTRKTLARDLYTKACDDKVLSNTSADTYKCFFPRATDALPSTTAVTPVANAGAVVVPQPPPSAAAVSATSPEARSRQRPR